MDTTPPQEPSVPLTFPKVSPRFQTLITLSAEAFDEQAYDTASLCLSAAFSDALQVARQTGDFTALAHVEAVAVRYAHQGEDGFSSYAEQHAITIIERLHGLRYRTAEGHTYDLHDYAFADEYTHGMIFPVYSSDNEALQEEENAREWELLLQSEGYTPLQNRAASSDSSQDAAVYDDIPPVTDDGRSARDAEEWSALVGSGSFTTLPDPDDPDVADNASGDPLGEEEITFALRHPDAPRDLYDLHRHLVWLFFFMRHPEAEALAPDERLPFESQFAQARDACEQKATQACELVGRCLGTILTDVQAGQPKPLSSDVLMNFWAALSLELQGRWPRE